MSSSSSGSGGGSYEPVPAPTPGATIIAQLRLGNNSSQSAPWELSIGEDTQSNNSTANRTWAAGQGQSFDSGTHAAQVIVPPSGGTSNPPTLVVGTDQQSINHPVSYGSIRFVQIQAAVSDAHCRFTIASMQVEFETAGGFKETVNIPNSAAPIADSNPNGTSAQQTLQVNPKTSNIARVTVSFTARMECDQPLPAAGALCGNVYVFTEDSSIS